MNGPAHSLKMFWRIIVWGACLLPALLSAQGNNVALRLANLEQDVRALQQTVGSMRLELEAMARENAQLRAQVQQELTHSRQGLVTLVELNQRLARLSTGLESSLEKSQQETIAEVAIRIETLAKQTSEAIQKLSQAVGDRPVIDPTVTFNKNFPHTGISYTVQPGDSLGKIAREHNSTVDWIRNANEIPGDIIHPNDQLFIPQKN